MFSPSLFVNVRLALFYAAIFGVVGVQLPFWPVWLASKGLSPSEIGVMAALSFAAKVVGNPLAARFADRRGDRRRPMVGLAVASFACFALFGTVDGFWPIFAVSLAFFLIWPTVLPLGESLTMLAVVRNGLDYGRIRLWGSLSFIAVAMLAGSVLEGAPADAVFWMMFAAIGFSAVVCLAVPDLRVERASPPRLSVLGILRDRLFATFLIAGGLIQGSHAVYYAFGTLHWRAVGYSNELIGALWAEGVVAEILLFAFGDPLVRAVGPSWLIALAGFAAALRWLATGLTDAVPALVVAQALHALTFGATHLGAIHFIARTVPPTASATAQSLYSAVVMGLSLGAMLLASGRLYSAFGASAYHAMAVAGLLGGLLAIGLIGRRKRC